MKCNHLAMYRYTWPGNNEAVVCEEHAMQISGLAKAIGMHLQLILLSEEDLKMQLKCGQNVEEE